MIKLYGFSVSNYHSKVKLALLEKGIPYEEVVVYTTGRTPEMFARSPLGKVPYIETEAGPLCESQVILDYLEAQYPDTTPLAPADPFAAAKMREILTFLELHLELVVRELYAEAFFGGKVSDETKASVKRRLDKAIPAFAKLAKFSPYVAGDMFTMADCAAICHLPLVTLATKIIYGEDLLASVPAVKAYLKAMAERPQVQRVTAERKANQEEMKAKAAAK